MAEVRGRGAETDERIILSNNTGLLLNPWIAVSMWINTARRVNHKAESAWKWIEHRGRQYLTPPSASSSLDREKRCRASAVTQPLRSKLEGKISISVPVLWANNLVKNAYYESQPGQTIFEAVGALDEQP